jgi:hypothetical protein
MMDYVRGQWQYFTTSVTLEPVILLFVFSNFLANGAQQNNNILLRKVCQDTLGYNNSVCSNHTEHPEVHMEALKETNM